MGCLIDNGSVENILNCKKFASGIQKIWVSNFYEDISAQTEVVDNEAQTVGGPSNYVELPIDDTGVFTETFNIEKRTYEQSLSFALVGRESLKRESVDILSKGRFTFVFLDRSGIYWLIFIENGSIATTTNFTTGNRQGRNVYEFTFTGSQKQSSLPIAELEIESVVGDVNCSDTWTELALTSTLYQPPYESCIVGDHPDFI